MHYRTQGKIGKKESDQRKEVLHKLSELEGDAGVRQTMVTEIERVHSHDVAFGRIADDVVKSDAIEQLSVAVMETLHMVEAGVKTIVHFSPLTAERIAKQNLIIVVHFLHPSGLSHRADRKGRTRRELIAESQTGSMRNVVK